MEPCGWHEVVKLIFHA